MDQWHKFNPIVGDHIYNLQLFYESIFIEYGLNFKGLDSG